MFIPKDLENAVAWYRLSVPFISAPLYCVTRDEFEGRLSKLSRELPSQFKCSENESYLIAAVVGEIGNNSFDHNLGHWIGGPGVAFGYTAIADRDLLVCIADQGRGIYRSLSAVHQDMVNDQTALEIAFDRKISGRFPEKRGNGLKFVRQVVNCDSPRGVWCRSASGQIQFGKLGLELGSQFGTCFEPKDQFGTFTAIRWRFS